MRQHKAICAVGGFKVVAAEGAGVTTQVEGTQAQKSQEERQSDHI